MKILLDRYPIGKIKGQRTAGRYIDGTFYENLKVLAEAITKDMTFLGIISSSTLEVGTGKSVFVQQTGEAWIDLVNTLHKQNLPELTMNNIVFKPKDLIERSFKVPKYSVIILDEWEDSHYWSELGITLRQFFRKCRQLNLLMLLIIPNFFQLPVSYAVTRSIFFIDVKFEGNFERGYYRFFNFNRKKDLYLKGKKNQDYYCIEPNFQGRFNDGYVVNEEEYRACKLKDLTSVEEKSTTPEPIKIAHKYFAYAYNELKDVINVTRLAKAFRISHETGYAWLREFEEKKNEISNSDFQLPRSNIIINPTEDHDLGRLEGEE